MREQVKQEILTAIDAAESKKAENLVILEMDPASGAFTDHFVICTGTNPRQMQAISDEIELQVKRTTGTYAHQVEGYREGEWILVDYVDFVVHIFSEERRAFYGLERLWRSAKTITVDELKAMPTSEVPRAAEPAQEESTAGRPLRALSTRAAGKKAASKSAKGPGKRVSKTATKKTPAKKKNTAKKATKRRS
ncbi:MAG TPA: ribosome silencing factor [Terriglobales bacterium]|jgi:ribosome-associated protein